MAIEFTSEIIDDLLVITTSGVDETLQDVQNYAGAIIETGLKSGCEKLLLDEKNLIYKLGTTDTFQLADFAATHAPRIGRIAIVCNADNFDDARFYENVVNNRGLIVKFFLDIEAAREWLDNDV